MSSWAPILTLRKEGHDRWKNGRLRYGRHRAQVGDLWLPAASAARGPVVVLIHGGFWRGLIGTQFMNPLAEAIAVTRLGDVEVAHLVCHASLAAHRATELRQVQALWNGQTTSMTAEDMALLGDLRLAGHRGELSASRTLNAGANAP